MSKAIEEMAAKDTIIEEVENVLWKYGCDLSIAQLEDCLKQAIKLHEETLTQFVNKPQRQTK